MKKLVLLLLLVFSAYMLPQQELFPETEIIFHTWGATGSTTTSFEVRPLLYNNFYPTTIYSQKKTPLCSLDIKLLPLQTIDLIGNVSCAYSGLEYIFSDESWVGDITCEKTSEYGPFGNSLNEINIKVNGSEKFSFLLDTRHQSLPNGCSFNCSGNDISIVYNVSSNTVGYVAGFWDGDPSVLDAILLKEYYTWGELRNECPDDFSNFNELNMPVLQIPTLQGNSPLLTWIKPQNLNDNTFYQYELQRSINGNSFITIFTSSDVNTTAYWDQEIFWNPNLTQTNIKYRLFAIFDVELEHMIIDVSNYQEITTSKWYIYKNNFSTNIKTLNLSDNYPNPFNPTTKIDFQIPVDGKVDIKVYDVLGNEIKTLLNEYIPSGSYTVDFNGIDLPSGVYLYKLNYNEYNVTKQMILAK